MMMERGETYSRSGIPCIPRAPSAHRVAVVHDATRVNLVVVETTTPRLYRRLAEYVRRECAHRLWPEDAAVVEQLLDEGRIEQAVDWYFSRVGLRWDAEWLTTMTVEPDVTGEGEHVSPGPLAVRRAG